MSYLEYLRSLITGRRQNISIDELQRIAESREIFDVQFVDTWKKDPVYIERLILNQIADSFQLATHFEFIEGASSSSNAFVVKPTDGEASALFLDEVLDLSILGIFITVWACAYKPKHLELCRKELSTLIKDVLVDRKSSYIGGMDIIQVTQMPNRAVTQAFDMYWCAWTFVIGHEIFHILNREELSVREEEFKADQFGFQVLIKFIEEKRQGKMINELDCFYEEYYLVPCMLMYIFRAMDEVRVNPPKYGSNDFHPSPEERMQAIIDLFDTDIPEDLDTTNGNAFLSTFLDTFDRLWVKENELIYNG